MPDVTLIGYPFGSTGRAEHVRAVWRALTTARVPAKIYDISGTEAPTRDWSASFGQPCDAAAQTLARFVDDPAYARAVGERARIHMRKDFSDTMLGQRYRTRLEAITAHAGSGEALLTPTRFEAPHFVGRGLRPDIQSG